jgi:phosphoglycolate phosphatase-like HAD superfamily hydrolase
VVHLKPLQAGEISRRSGLLAVAGAIASALSARYAVAQTPAPTTPLASWNDGPAKQAIVEFVRATTDQTSKDFVAPEDRITTFDQDGTLWVEHPLYSQALFALDRVHELAPQHPEWQNQEPFKAVLANDMASVAHFTEGEWAEIIFLTHAGMSQEAFLEIARKWLATAKHPRFKRLYTDLTYQPMHEVMDYLRAKGFKTYIVSGFGQDFMRGYGQRVYGIPPQQIIGSSLATKYEVEGGKPVLMRLPKLLFNCNFAGKVIGIDLFIGKRPYASIGNSTGDRQMLEWAGAGDGSRLRMLVLHDDPVREYAYGPASGLPDTSVGTFDQSLMDEARAKGWIVISMKNDWRRVFAFE